MARLHKDYEVTAGDVSRVLEVAKAVPIPADQKLLHTVAQNILLMARKE